MNKKPPALRRHRRSGHGYARLDGRQVWFGPYEDSETHWRFARTLAEWIANGRRLPRQQTREVMRVADIVAAYQEFVERFYIKPNGMPTAGRISIGAWNDRGRAMLGSRSGIRSAQQLDTLERIRVRSLPVIWVDQSTPR